MHQAIRLSTSHAKPGQKSLPAATVVDSIDRKRCERAEVASRRRREKDRSDIEFIRASLLSRFGELTVQERVTLDLREQILRLMDGRLYEASATAVKEYASKSGRFKNFKRTFYRYARHLTMLRADSDVMYLKQVLRQAIDPELLKFLRMLRAFDRQVSEPRTYRALLESEINRVLRIDLRALAMSTIREAEEALIGFADTGRRLLRDSHANRAYVHCRLGSKARTECFIVLEVQDGKPSEILALQSPKEFNRSQQTRLKSPKGDITKRGQRYANRPVHLRPHLSPRPRLLSWTRGLFRLKMALINYMDVFISHFSEVVGQIVNIRGWAQNVRSSGSIAFIQVRDGSGFVQAVISKASVDEASWNAAVSATLESTLEIIGVVAKHPKQEGVFELQATTVQLLQKAEEYPLGKKEHGPDFLLDNRHLWLRAPSQWAVQRVRDCIIRATYEWFHQHDYVKIDSPILTPNACEGTTELFEIDYFGERTAYLSQSGQLYLEAAIASVGRCFDFGPVFRAEKSKTRRHLIEFWMMDAEAAFVDHEGNMRIQEQLIEYIVQKVLTECRTELKTLERDVTPLENVKAPFYRLTHAEAIAKLRELGSDIGEMDDLGADDETTLTKLYDKPIFIEKYPTAVKAFYMKRDPQDETRVLNSDLLAPEGYGEIIGGSQREDDYEKLLARIREHNLPEEAFRWYLDLRKYGSSTHSGFGYGLERIVAWICGLHHVRETIPFPRLINRLEP